VIAQNGKHTERRIEFRKLHGGRFRRNEPRADHVRDDEVTQQHDHVGMAGIDAVHDLPQPLDGNERRSDMQIGNDSQADRLRAPARER
jgi:hypothetical protein